MATRYLGDRHDDGTSFGFNAADLISFHGSTPCDQAAVVTLASAATVATAVAAVQAILVALKEKGLMASA